jgi:putative spermidine/putrescine transport system ATP-binding protein
MAERRQNSVVVRPSHEFGRPSCTAGTPGTAIVKNAQNIASWQSPSLTIRGVSKRYGETTALYDLDLDVAAGEFVTLLGPSGSGKTTLLMILAGFVRPNAGSVKVGDEEIVATPPHKRNVGMVFQSYALFPHMNVADNIAFPLRQRRMASKEIGDRVAGTLELVQLAGYGQRRVDQLSGGQKQRVALARAIVFEPRILLMDEPLSALDKRLREQMQIEIRHLHERLGMTTIYVTHDQREAITMSDRIAVMNAGRIVQLDTAPRLYAQPRTRFVAEFIGESSLLPIEVNGRGACLGDAVLKLAEAPRATVSRQWLVVRPEKLRIVDEHIDIALLNVFEGTVKELIYQGESFLCYVQLRDGAELAFRNYSQREILAKLPPTGSPIRLGLAPEDASVVSEDDVP